MTTAFKELATAIALDRGVDYMNTLTALTSLATMALSNTNSEASRMVIVDMVVHLATTCKINREDFLDVISSLITTIDSEPQ